MDLCGREEWVMMAKRLKGEEGMKIADVLVT